MPEPTFRCVHLTNRGGDRDAALWHRPTPPPWVFSPPYPTLRAAKGEVARVLAEGLATLALVVVEREGGVRAAMPTTLKPESTGKVVRHYLDLIALLGDRRIPS
jgi:hypothetical protein